MKKKMQIELLSSINKNLTELVSIVKAKEFRETYEKQSFSDSLLWIIPLLTAFKGFNDWGDDRGFGDGGKK